MVGRSGSIGSIGSGTIAEVFYYKLEEEIELRPLTRRFTDELYQLIHQNRPHLREWLPWVDSTDSVEALGEFVRSAERQLADDDGFQAVILVSSRIAGSIGFHSIDWYRRTTTLGYWLGTEFTGRGIITRAGQALVHYALCDRELERVEIQCAIGNEPSRAIARRLGFVEEGTRRGAERLYGRQLDLVVHGMTRADWRCTEPCHLPPPRKRGRRS